VKHYTAIAKSVDIPQILYNVPGRTACDLLPETVGRLSRLANIVGLKEATGDVSRLDALLPACTEGFAFYSGDDATSREFCLRGGHGVISVTANVAPGAMHDLCVTAMAGRRGEATAIDEALAGLHRDLFIESNPIPVKWALHEMGLIDRGIRLPLTWLSTSCEENVRAAMRQAGVI
jgi:4-hydroxy-tetrahydrodipicolinate synthase